MPEKIIGESGRQLEAHVEEGIIFVITLALLSNTPQGVQKTNFGP